MPHFEKHSKGMQALIDTSEAMLNAMETNGIDPETVSNRPEFTVLVHFLKSIIDGELNIPARTSPQYRLTKRKKKSLIQQMKLAAEFLGLDELLKNQNKK